MPFGRRTTISSEWTPERIKELRKAFDETQAVFGSRIGVSGPTIAAWEQGLYAPGGPASKHLDNLAEEKGIT